MRNTFNNQVQKVRDGVTDLRNKNKEPQPNSEVSIVPSGPPEYYYHPPPTSTPNDPYSHTANSTAAFAQRNAYPTLATPKPEAEKQTFLGKVESTTTNLLGHVVGQDRIVSVANQVNSSITSGRNARELLQTGAVVQLLSKSSDHLLQVVMSSNGALVFDGSSANNSFNTYFTIEEGEKGRVRLHNNFNYLAFDGKQPCIISLPPGPKNNPSIDFRVQDILGSSELIAFESCACKNHFISISPDGHLKTKNIKDKNTDAQFSVQPITFHQQSMYPYPQFNVNPQGVFPSNGPSGFMSPQPPMYQQQPSAPPPPVYSTPSSSSQPSASSGLYPQFN